MGKFSIILFIITTLWFREAGTYEKKVSLDFLLTSDRIKSVLSYYYQTSDNNIRHTIKCQTRGEDSNFTVRLQVKFASKPKKRTLNNYEVQGRAMEFQSPMDIVLICTVNIDFSFS